jgi:flagellar biosynthesis protein FlhB
MLKNMATLFGWVLLVVGVLGFVPGITQNGMLLGMFAVNAMLSLLHIITGLAGLYAASQGEPSSKMFFQVFGVVYLIIAILGFMSDTGMVLGLFANNMADTWLNVVIALVALYLGFASKAEHSTQTV